MPQMPLSGYRPSARRYPAARHAQRSPATAVRTADIPKFGWMTLMILKNF